MHKKNPSKRFLPSGNFDSHSPSSHPLVLHKITIFFKKKREKTSEHCTSIQFACIQTNSREGGEISKHLSGKMCTYMNFVYCINNFFSLIHRLNIDQNVCTQKFCTARLLAIVAILRRSFEKSFHKHQSLHSTTWIYSLMVNERKRHKENEKKTA